MQPQDIVDLAREALVTAMLIGTPLLAVCLLAGIAVSLLQSFLHIQDSTLVFVPKLLATAVALAVLLPWLLDRLLAYSHDLMVQAPRMIVGG